MVEIGLELSDAEKIAKEAKDLERLTLDQRAELRALAEQDAEVKSLGETYGTMLDELDDATEEFAELVSSKLDKKTRWNWARLQARQHELKTYRGPYAEVMKFSDLQKRIIKKYIRVQISQFEARVENAKRREKLGLKYDPNFNRKAVIKRVFDMFYELGATYDDQQWRTYLRLRDLIKPGATLDAAVAAMEPPQQSYFLNFERLRELWLQAGRSPDLLP